MPRRRTADSRNPGPLVGHRFEVVAYEHRALRGIHDAMCHQLAAGEAEKASQTAVLLLEQLKACWLNQSLDDFFSYFITDDEEPDFEALNHLRYIDRTRGEEFGVLEPRTGTGT